MSNYWNRISMLAITAGLGALLTAGVLIALSALGVIGAGGTKRGDPGTNTTFGVRLEQIATATPNPDAGPAPTPSGPPPSDAPVSRLIIPKIKVDAAIVPMGLDSEGVMESPKNAYDVAWYTFSSKPGFPGNAVFSGHVDYHDVGRAVLWNMVHPEGDIPELEPGDDVQVRLEDGTVYDYKVVSLNHYPADEAPVDRILQPGLPESVTIITCSGHFDSKTRQYDHRAVLLAERQVPEAPPPATDASP